MTITVTNIVAGPFVGTGLAQVMGFDFKAFTDVEVEVFYLVDGEDVIVDPDDYVVSLNEDLAGARTEGGTVTMTATLGRSMYLRANPLLTQDQVWTNQGSRLANLNEALDRAHLVALRARYDLERGIGSFEASEAAVAALVAAAQAAAAAAAEAQTVSEGINVVVAGVYADMLALQAMGDPAAAIATRAAKAANGSDFADPAAVRTNIGADLSVNVNFTPSGTGGVTRSVQAKVRERITIDDFGAIGDGTLHTAAEWIIPGALGRYANLAALQVDYPFVVSTGESIDGVAIQAGYNAVSTAGGGRLGAGGGKTYVVNHTAGLGCVTLKSNVVLTGWATTIKLGAAAGSCALFYSADAVTNLRFEGITLDGNSPTVVGDTRGVRAENITGLTFEDCVFENLRQDPVLVGQTTLAENVRFDTCVFRDIGTAGVEVNGIRVYHSRGLVVHNCDFHGFIASPIDTNPTPGGDVATQITLTDNYLFNDGTNWLPGYSAISLLAERVKCEGNVVINGGHIVVHDYVGSGETTRDYRITNNSLLATINGIIISQGENSEITATGNIISGAHNFGVQVLNISGVVAINTVKIGLNIITDTSTDTVYTNTNQPVGILLMYANNVQVIGNDVITPRFAGIWSSGASNVTIKGNGIIGQQGHPASDFLSFCGAGIIVSAGGFGAPVDVRTVIVRDNTVIDFLTALAGTPSSNIRTGGIVAFNDTSGAATMDNIVIKGNDVIGGNGIGIQTYMLESVAIGDDNTIVGCLAGAQFDTSSNVLLQAKAAVNPASLATGISTAIATVAVTGAAMGDKVDATFSLDLAGARIEAWVSAADTVSYFFTNVNGTNPLDLGAGTLKVRARR